MKMAWVLGLRTVVEALVFDLRLLITGRAPQVLFPEVGQGSFDPSDFQAVVRLGTFLGQRPQNGLVPTLVQSDASHQPNIVLRETDMGGPCRCGRGQIYKDCCFVRDLGAAILRS